MLFSNLVACLVFFLLPLVSGRSTYIYIDESCHDHKDFSKYWKEARGLATEAYNRLDRSDKDIMTVFARVFMTWDSQAKKRVKSQ